MPSDLTSSLDLPPGITADRALEIAHQFAPLLFLHRHEAHLPDKPDSFKQFARFRESNYRYRVDRGYHKHEGWKETDDHGSDYLDISWNVIHKETHVRFAFNALNPPHSQNLRPHDHNNLYGNGRNKGLFLELAEDLGKGKSGMPLSKKSCLAPVFVDIGYNPEKSIVKILFWFFYTLNWWKCFITHEGDWEHITIFFTEDAFSAGRSPSWIYFSQHNCGVPIHFSKIRKEVTDGGVHPVIYVDRNGHPCNPSIKNPEKYLIRWETWKCQLNLVTDCPWRGFAGAWGEVGISATTTGPLGPLFKRHNDNVRAIVKKGRLYISMPKTWRL